MIKILSSLAVLLFILGPAQFAAFGECIEGNCVDGNGTYVFDDGETYTGDFKNGEKHGQGIYIYANGDRYVGQFSNGKKADTALTHMPMVMYMWEILKMT